MCFGARKGKKALEEKRREAGDRDLQQGGPLSRPKYMPDAARTGTWVRVRAVHDTADLTYESIAGRFDVDAMQW